MSLDQIELPASEDVFNAAQNIAGMVHQTPLLSSRQLNELTGANLWFKCEHLQKVGAFKARGAANALSLLPEGVDEVATHSSGNHGAALAWAAAERGIPCTVVIPENAPKAKRIAVKGYGAKIVTSGPSLGDRESTLAKVLEETGAHEVPSYDDKRIIAGQGTVALEVLQQSREQGIAPDVIVAPVGGGGLLAGVGLTISALAPDILVIGAEPAAADDAHRSLRGGVHITTQQPNTIADGLRTTLGGRNYAVIERTVRDIVTVSEAGIVNAMRLLWTRTKQLVEPSAAVGFAAVIEHNARFRNKNVVVVLTGGNMDLDKVGPMLSSEEN
ncbi:serine dehydratase [Microbulbifer sp. A4B17]|uniref:threonine ammonia-lyase n=1 Tax=Microbulbifer sp. A4B17 TaxID=359370 RepID=UPI000D52B884|nr:threonine/serine dehydratase [Microbulbifer sp. A4B17]AWF80309.1 serine dehydratase [Microbulbifer sp. A4B17]